MSLTMSSAANRMQRHLRDTVLKHSPDNTWLNAGTIMPDFSLHIEGFNAEDSIPLGQYCFLSSTMVPSNQFDSNSSTLVTSATGLAQSLTTVLITPAPVGQGTSVEQIFTLPSPLPVDPSLISNCVLTINVPAFQAGLLIIRARIVDPSTIAIVYFNHTGLSITPTAQNYNLLLTWTGPQVGHTHTSAMDTTLQQPQVGDTVLVAWIQGESTAVVLGIINRARRP